MHYSAEESGSQNLRPATVQSVHWMSFQLFLEQERWSGTSGFLFRAPFPFRLWSFWLERSLAIPKVIRHLQKWLSDKCSCSEHPSTLNKSFCVNTTLKPELASFQIYVMCVFPSLNISEMILATEKHFRLLKRFRNFKSWR